MPFKSPERRLQALAKDLAGLGMAGGFGQRMVLMGMRRAVVQLTREEFQKSTGPEGAWKETVRGKPALVSKKLPQAFRIGIVPGKIVGTARSKRDLLEAHQEGHVFAARSVKANQQYLSYNRKGKLVKEKRIVTKETRKLKNIFGLFGRKTVFRKGAYQRFAGAHRIGRRVLPARAIIPRGSDMPPLWSTAIAAGAEEGLGRWMAKVSK